eukprot:2176472-Pleurochrysis_carterae.AAC.2
MPATCKYYVDDTLVAMCTTSLTHERRANSLFECALSLGKPSILPVHAFPSICPILDIIEADEEHAFRQKP